MTSTHSFRRRDGVTLLLILVVAALLRAGDLAGITVFLYDQGDLSLLTLDMVTGKAFPTLGIESSAGVANSPVTVYTLALPFAVWADAQFVTVCIALANVAGVGVLWAIAHRYLSPRVAALAGLAYALNPHAVRYSRSIWAQDYQTVFILLAFWLALYGIVERKRAWAQVMSVPVFVWGVQIHYAAWTLVPAFVALVVIGRKHIAWRALIAGVVLGGLTLIPFAVGVSNSDDTSDGFSGQITSTRAIIKYDLRLREAPLHYVADLATGQQALPVAPDVRAVLLPHMQPYTRLWQLIGLVTLLGAASLWASRDDRRVAVLLTLWIVLPVAFFVPNWLGRGVYPHYFIYLIPALSLLTGAGFARIMDWLPKRLPIQAVAAGVIGISLLPWGWWHYSYLRAWDTTYHPQVIMTPLHYLKDVRAALEPYDDVLIVGGDSSTSGYTVWQPLLYHTARVREVVSPQGSLVVYPPGSFAVLSPPTAPDSELFTLYDSGAPRQVPLRPGEGSYTIHAFEHAPDWPGPALIPVDPIRYANGMHLTGYAVVPDGVYLAWRLPDANPNLGYQRYFWHLLDANGDRIAQQDVDLWPGKYWRADDRLITWINLDVPGNAETLRAGLYTVGDGTYTYTDVVTDTGQPVAPWADIPLAPPDSS